MIMNNSTNKSTSNPQWQLWKSTRINPKNPSNVYLFVSRKTGPGTMPISVAPHQYLSKLQEYNISLNSLNIPVSCPVFEDIKANQTARILWNRIQCITKPIISSTTISSGDNNLVLHNKLDLIMNMLGVKNIQDTMQYLHVIDEKMENRNNNNCSVLHNPQHLNNCPTPTNIDNKIPTKDLLWTLHVATLKLQHCKPHDLSQKGPKYVLIERIYEHYDSIHHIYQ
eukprot:148568_1